VRSLGGHHAHRLSATGGAGRASFRSAPPTLPCDFGVLAPGPSARPPPGFAARLVQWLSPRRSSPSRLALHDRQRQGLPSRAPRAEGLSTFHGGVASQDEPAQPAHRVVLELGARMVRPMRFASHALHLHGPPRCAKRAGKFAPLHVAISFVGHGPAQPGQTAGVWLMLSPARRWRRCRAASRPAGSVVQPRP
jgi:hypothetical protein